MWKRRSWLLAATAALFLGASTTLAQGWTAVDKGGREVYHLVGSDSLRVLSPGVLMVKEGGAYYLRSAINGTVLGGAVRRNVETMSFGLRLPMAETGWVGLMSENRLFTASCMQDAGKGWAMIRNASQHITGIYGAGEVQVQVPDGTDSLHALSARHLVFFVNKKAGLITVRGLSWSVTLPAVYDSITGPASGYVLAHSGEQGQLYLDNGQPVYSGSFEQAAFLNTTWMAGKTGVGWQAIYLPSLKHIPCLKEPVGVGRTACLLIKKGSLAIYDSAGREAGAGLLAAICQEGTQRLVVKKATKWYMLSAAGQPSIQMKTPTILQLKGFSEGLAALCTGLGMWGFVDAHGFMRISPRYEYCQAFMAGVAGVRIAGKWGLIDKAERLVCQPLYDTAFADAALGLWFCQSGAGAAVYNGGIRIGDYVEARPGPSCLLVRDRSGWGVVAPNGKPLIPNWYGRLEICGKDRFIAQRDGDWSVLNTRHETCSKVGSPYHRI